MTALLEVAGLDVRYGPARAVHGVSFTVGRGSTLSVLGPNGAGKSTLSRALSGLIACAAGVIRFDGTDVTALPAHRRSRLGLVQLPETRGIFPALSVIDNLRTAALQVPRAGRKEMIEQALAMAPRLGQRLRQVAGTLSGGEQQMLALARVLAVQPRLAVIDELSVGLAPLVVDEVYAVLAEARQQRELTVVLVEQFVHRAISVSDDCLVLRRGTIAWRGTAAQARDSDEIDYLLSGTDTS